VDFIFSYWIFGWYILYISKIITCCSPKFALILAIIENIITSLSIVVNGASISTIIKSIIVNIVVKYIPFYTIRNDEINKNDIFFTLLLFVFYLLWLQFNGVGMLDVYKNMNKSLIHNKGHTPGIMLIDNILEFIRNRLLHS
jgi:hypothetical protein